MSNMIDIQILFSRRLKEKAFTYQKQIEKSATKTRTRVHVLYWFPYHYTTTPTQQKREEILLYKYNLASFCNKECYLCTYQCKPREGGVRARGGNLTNFEIF